ncbi:tetratricopeptide repeat protein [Treponema sp.]|uniref:tetratricopeptide repeat protein n=1 Tax=Treponema sp. TaxID=166 RepID=UPI00388DE244
MKRTTLKTIIFSIAFTALLSSCTSTPKEIPEDLTAQELIQKGQAAFENGKYKESLRYYNAVTERYADSPAVYVEATYEIGHVFMKQKKYEQAEEVLTSLIELYQKAQPGTLPGAYQKLSQLELDKIAEKKN